MSQPRHLATAFKLAKPRQPATINRMLLPRYSLRAILLITAVCAVICLIVSMGMRGNSWAVGVSMGLLALVTAVVVQALGFFLVWLSSLLLRRRGATSANELPRSTRSPSDARSGSAS